MRITKRSEQNLPAQRVHPGIHMRESYTHVNSSTCRKRMVRMRPSDGEIHKDIHRLRMAHRCPNRKAHTASRQLHRETSIWRRAPFPSRGIMHQNRWFSVS